VFSTELCRKQSFQREHSADEHTMPSRTQIRRLAILAYHKVGEPPGGWATWSYVSQEKFESHLCMLRDHGWDVIDVATFLAGLGSQDTLPPKAALITFDDGYRSNLDVAAPVLRRFGYPAVIFVPTLFIGGYNAFDADIQYEPREAMCEWNELSALERNGISVQSHGVSHRRLSELSSGEQEHELAASKAVLESELGKRVEFFSFPYGDGGGDPSAIADMLARCGYQAACLYGGGAMQLPINDRFRLARVAVGPDTNLASELRTG
jgi:peptidoglycan/xylan/chitin deacetylase (PgdA/CDA1 family)